MKPDGREDGRENGRGDGREERPEEGRERRIRRLVRTLSLALLLLAFAYYVWPTPYRYGYERLLGTTVHVRTHRLTGKSYIALDVTGQGWRAAIMNPLVCRVTWTERAP